MIWRGPFSARRPLLLWVGVLSVLSLAACGKKTLPKSTARQVTREIVASAEQITAHKSQITIRPEPGLDDIVVASLDPSQANELRRSIAGIAHRHGLSLNESSSNNALRLDLSFDGIRTHGVELEVSSGTSVAEGSREVPAGPRLAIILDDLGYDQAAADAVFALPFRLTVSVLPRLPLSSHIAEQAYRRGDQVLLHFPMEPNSGAAQHERVELTPGMTSAQIGSTLAEMLKTVPHAVGVNNHEGSLATADPALMRELMPWLRSDGLFFIDSRTTPATVAYTAARESGVAAASRNVFLDDVSSTEAILAQLNLAARDASLHGFAIAIGHPRPATLTALAKGVPLLKAKGVRLVFASDLVQRQN